jgi:hypothetical protein
MPIKQALRQEHEQVRTEKLTILSSCFCQMYERLILRYFEQILNSFVKELEETTCMEECDS